MYIVTRDYNYDLDKNHCTWYVMFITPNYNTAEEFMNKINLNEFGKVYLSEVPTDTELDIICWERKYVIEERSITYQ